MEKYLSSTSSEVIRTAQEAHVAIMEPVIKHVSNLGVDNAASHVGATLDRISTHFDLPIEIHPPNSPHPESDRFTFTDDYALKLREPINQTYARELREILQHAAAVTCPLSTHPK